MCKQADIIGRLKQVDIVFRNGLWPRYGGGFLVELILTFEGGGGGGVRWPLTVL